MTIHIETYSGAWFETTVSLLADAFVANPLHIAVFGAHRLEQSRSFFRIALRHMFTGPAFAALSDGMPCGYMHFKRSPDCLPAPEEIPSVAANLLTPFGDAMPRILRWMTRWSHLDPAEPHLHLGPLAVAPAAQGQGAGSALMQRYIDHLKKEQLAGYLETDRPANVVFYEKFGFTVQHQEILIDAPIWTMWRPQNA